MPYNTAPRCPEPQEGHAGRTTRERKWKHALAYVAQLWRPSNTLEQTHATVSRYAMHLIDLTTGAAYTVQQLLGATASVAWSAISGKPTTLAGYGITDAAAASHPHTSASITDASTGGNGGADSGKLAKFDLSGNLLCQSLFANIAVTAGGEDIGDGEIHIASIEGASTKLVGTAGAANVTISFPANSGTLALTTHEHVSANITDASTGGNGAADSGKLAKFDTVGALSGSSLIGYAISGYSVNGYGIVGASETENFETYGFSAGVLGYSSTGSGVRAYTINGDYHAFFGLAGSNRSFVARLNGAYGWVRGAFTSRIEATGVLTANRICTLPDINGAIAVCPTYADDAAAASGGLAIGDLYFTGTKFRVRTA